MEQSRIHALEVEVQQLRSRLAAVEAALGQTRQNTEPATESVPLPDSLPASAPAPERVFVPSAPPPFAALRASTSSALHIPADEASFDDSLETRIGARWFNRIGIVAVLVAMAWFLKLAIDNHWVGPLGRVSIGLLSGAGLIAWSERFRQHGYRTFSYSLKALGSSLLYLSLWTAFALYQLLPAGAAFALMIVIAACNAAMSYLQDSELLAAYALAGSLATPALVSTGENHPFVLFGYMLLINAALLWLTALKPWGRLIGASFTGTAFYFYAWLFTQYDQSQMAIALSVALLFYALFAVAPRLMLPADGPEGWGVVTEVLVPLLNGLWSFSAVLYILGNTRHWPWSPWAALGFAAAYLAILNLPARSHWKPAPPMVQSIYLAAAVVLLTIAIPLKTSGRWITVGWLVEGAALVALERRAPSKLLAALGLMALVLGIAGTICIDPLPAAHLLFNQRFACFLVAIAATLVVALIVRRWPTGDATLCDGEQLAALSAITMHLLFLVAVGWEIDSYWWRLHWIGRAELVHSYQMYAQFTYSAFFMLWGAVLLAAGFWKRSAFARWQALILLSATIAKVFLVDMGSLSEGYRILSFLGLGALLLGVSFVYQRDWLRLRAPAESRQTEVSA